MRATLTLNGLNELNYKTKKTEKIMISVKFYYLLYF